MALTVHTLRRFRKRILFLTLSTAHTGISSTDGTLGALLNTVRFGRSMESILKMTIEMMYFARHFRMNHQF